MKTIAIKKNPISHPQPPTEGLTEEAQRTTGVGSSVGGTPAPVSLPDPEVPEQKPRRSFHADRGSSMKSKSVALLLSDLGVIKSHSRPHVSNDNPFSESQFKTLKHCPSFPGQFGCIQETRACCQQFFN